MGKKDKSKEQTPHDVRMPSLSSDYPIYPLTATSVENGVTIEETSFSPVGYGHELQRLITLKLHELVMEMSTKTLAEMGYLHRVMVSYEDGKIRIRIYFHPELATYKEETANGQYVLKPIPELMIMNKYFFIVPDNGDATGIIGIEKVLAPRGKVEYDELGRRALRLKRDGTDLKYQEAVYVECNLPITIAAVMNISLDDPSFKVTAETIGQPGQERNIMIDGKENSYPVWIHAAYTSPRHDDTHVGYSTDDVIPYLTMLAECRERSYKNTKKLTEKVSDTAKKKEKKEKKKSSSSKFC